LEKTIMLQKIFMSLSAVLMIGVFLVIAGCAGAGSQQHDITKVEIKTVPVDDITIAYKEVGSGEPLILIMGYSSTMDFWDTRVVNELAKQYRVIIFDNRGMGHSTSSEKVYTIPLFADDTAGLMDALNIKKAHVLGFSMGTTIAQELALDHPEKVDKLILYAGDPGSKEMVPPAQKDLDVLTNTTGTNAERGHRLFSELFPEEWLQQNPDPTKYFPMVSSMSPAANVQRQAMAMGMWNGSYSRLPNMTQPLLLIAGDQDVLTPPENSRIIAERVPSSWMIRIRGGGHGLMYQYPEEFTNIVLTFLTYGR
jgi:pimeloyl-ACP methyl ester carboxylesterase